MINNAIERFKVEFKDARATWFYYKNYNGSCYRIRALYDKNGKVVRETRAYRISRALYNNAKMNGIKF
jgi:hypothetical protein